MSNKKMRRKEIEKKELGQHAHRGQWGQVLQSYIEEGGVKAKGTENDFGKVAVGS